MGYVVLRFLLLAALLGSPGFVLSLFIGKVKLSKARSWQVVAVSGSLALLPVDSSV